VLAACLLALTESDGDDVDRQTAALIVAESILMWRRSVTNG
jgi:hypothetical protein